MEKGTIISIIRGVDPDNILAITEALIESGINWMEVSLSDEEKGLECIRRISKMFSDKINLGVGTVITPRQVDASIEAGAQYIITPGWDRELVKYVMSKNINIFPGVFSPGEIMQAVSLGIATVKLFPANSLDNNYIKNIKGPFPKTKFMAVGGVNKKNIPEFKNAGYDYFAIGSELVPRGATKADISTIKLNAEAFHRINAEE